MDSQKVKQLLQKEEGFKLDFKLKLVIEQDSDKKEFVKDVIAIANTPGGRGYILYGIEDHTKRIVGLTQIPINIEERLQQIIAHRSRPPVSIRWDEVKISGKIIGVLTIYKSNQIPHQMMGLGSFYVRRGSTTDVATRHEIATMLQTCGLVSFETVTCYLARIEDLDVGMIEGYLGKPIELAHSSPMLSALGLVTFDEFEKVSYPTYGGLLVFGKRPQDFLPHTQLEVITDKRIKVICGNILDQLTQFKDYVPSLLAQAYPVEALIEVVTNALIHRDYWNQQYCTTVQITEKSIVVSNPSAQDYELGDQPRARTNSWLYARLLLLHRQSERVSFGIGLETVRQSFERNEQFRVENDSKNKLFKFYLPGNQYDSSTH